MADMTEKFFDIFKNIVLKMLSQTIRKKTCLNLEFLVE